MLKTAWIDSLRMRLSKPRWRRALGRSGVQSLETRAMLTVTSTFNAALDLLDVASDADDAIVVSQSEGTVSVNGELIAQTSPGTRW